MNQTRQLEAQQLAIFELLMESEIFRYEHPRKNTITISVFSVARKFLVSHRAIISFAQLINVLNG